MHANGFDLADTIMILTRTPANLHGLLAGLPERWVRATDGADAWSPFDVLVHLIQGERTNWILRAQHILAGEQDPFPPFERMGAAAEYQQTGIADLLALFAELRRTNLAALAGMNLTPADLARTGLHPEFGPVQLGQLLATWVVHDLNHLGQIGRALASVYGAAVGPWRAYLAILENEA